MSSWYSYQRLLSYNIFMNMVMSPRGNGKSYGAKKLIIDNFLKNGKQSVYIRRTKTELDGIKDKYWHDIMHEYPNCEFDVKGYIGYINGEIAVHFIPLSTSGDRKSDAFPFVTQMFFDEYVITQTSHKRYLKNEMTLFFDIIETVFRKRTDARVILMSNAVSYVNPLFDYYDIQPNPNLRFQRFHNKQILLELFTDQKFIEEKLETPFGRLIAGTEYGNYAISNEVLEDTNDFIRKKRNEGQWCYMCAIRTMKRDVGCWYNPINKEVFIDNRIVMDSDKYTVLIEDNTEGYEMLKHNRTKWETRTLKRCFNEGRVYYMNQSTKKHFEIYIARYL